MATPILIAKSGKTQLHLLPALANRHGPIGSQVGREIIRGVLGSILGAGRRH